MLRYAPFLVAIAFSLTMYAAPPDTYNVRAYGAKGDSATLDTDAINRAITAATSAGGSTVLLRAGRYRSYSIRLRSHVALYLDQAATLLAALPVGSAGYDAPEPAANDIYQDFEHSHWHNSLIWGKNLVDVSILGPGTIYSQGLMRGGPHQAPVGNKTIALKPRRTAILRDSTVRQDGHFALLATGVNNLSIDNLKLDTNRDGLDIDCCHNVRVCNCVFEYCRGLALETADGGLLENVVVSNITMRDIINCIGYAIGGSTAGRLLNRNAQVVWAHTLAAVDAACSVPFITSNTSRFHRWPCCL